MAKAKWSIRKVLGGHYSGGKSYPWYQYNVYHHSSLYQSGFLTRKEAEEYIKEQKDKANVSYKPNPSNQESDWIPVHAIRKLPDGSIQLMTEKGVLSNPGKRKSFLGKVRRLFSNPESKRDPIFTESSKDFKSYNAAMKYAAKLDRQGRVYTVQHLGYDDKKGTAKIFRVKLHRYPK